MTNNNNICLDDYYIRKSSTNASDIVSTEHNGLMTSSDKTKLNSLDVHPNNLPAYSLGLYKVATNTNGHITNATAVTQNDLANLGIGGQETGTFEELQTLISAANSGDTIVLDKDYKNSDSGNPLNLGGKTLTIIGNGHILDGNGRTIITSGWGSLYLTAVNIHFINGGGAITTLGGSLNLNKCSFTNNTAISSNNGGALAIQSGNTYITECNFNNNSAPSGGAIYVQSRNMNIHDCTFSDNHATDDGANIYYHPLSDEVLTIYNCHVSTGLYNTVNYDYVTTNHSHSFNDLTNKPSIPTDISDLTDTQNTFATRLEATVDSLINEANQ